MLQFIRLFRFTFMKKKITVYYGETIKRTIHNVGLNDIPKITATDMRKLLRQKGHAVQEGYTALTIKCSICSGDQKCSDGKVYVNKTTGYFVCPKCNVHGDWNILERLVKKAKVDTTIKDFIEQCQQKSKQFEKDWQDIVNKSMPLNQLEDTVLYDLFKLFEFPFHPEANKLLSEVRVSSDRSVLYFPLKNSLDKVVGYRKLQAGKEDETENFGLHTAGLFFCRASKVSRSDQAILVPTIQDVLHLGAEKIPGTLVWLSNCSLPPIVLPTLENYQKLCLWGDWDNMRSVAEKLSEDRCRFVRLS